MSKNNILGMIVDVSSLEDALSKIKGWSTAYNQCGHYVCLSNVHMCMEAYDNKPFQAIVNGADLVLADGKPIYWAQKLLGTSTARQVRGTELSLKACKMASDNNIPVGLYGSTQDQLIKLTQVLQQLFPTINIVCEISPPFRPLTNTEDQQFIKHINESGARILLVGLGCPKQEAWMANHKSELKCVMLGVGAAFDFISGSKRSAPQWMSSLGLEWLYRFMSEPRRLWRRYLKHNPRYLYLFFKQLLLKKQVQKITITNPPNA